MANTQNVAMTNLLAFLKKNRKTVVIVSLAVIFFGLLVIFFLNNRANNNVACTLEAKICPDGSSVGREGPQCEFKACPTVVSSDTEVSFRTIDSRSGFSASGIQTQEFFTVLNLAEYNQLMTRLSPHSESKIDLPDVDFTKEMVIAAFAGQKSTGGYSIEIKKITKTGKKLFVQIEMTNPGRSCLNTQALTSPYHIVAIPAGDYQIEFLPTEVTVNCTE